ncbi:hypothetical protein RDI58_003105 [Solanum bulbocastanum]|uniref:Uncharacterized protein n=1 Tax=Solanum bulbocastanum TaxID=147425 RepID=A0AAN8YRJ5_SOLBU
MINTQRTIKKQKQINHKQNKMNHRNKEGSKSCISCASPSPSRTYPTDSSEAAPEVTSFAPSSVAEVQASSQDDVEMALLNEQENFPGSALRMVCLWLGMWRHNDFFSRTLRC